MDSPATAYAEGQELLESAVTDEALDASMARNRFLQRMGAALFGAATMLFLPRYADAHCSGNINHPCYGYPMCKPWSSGCQNTEATCCSNTLNECHPWCQTGDHGCPSNAACWIDCHEHVRYKCCDCLNPYDYPENVCICRYQLGTC